MKESKKDKTSKITTSYYIKKNWKATILPCMLIIFYVATRVALTFIEIQLTDMVIYQKFDKIVFWIIITLLLWAVLLLVTLAQDVSIEKASAKMNMSLQEDVSNLIMNKSFSNYHKKDTGEYMAWYVSNAANIEINGFKNFFEVFADIVTLVFAVVSLLTLHWSIPAITLPMAFLLLFVPKHFNKKLAKASEVLANVQEQYSNEVKDNLSGVELIKSFGIKKFFLNKMFSTVDKFQKGKIQFTVKKSTTVCLMSSFNVLGQVVVNFILMTLACFRVITPGSVSAGNLVSMVFNGIAGFMSDRLLFASSNAFIEQFGLDAGDNKLLLPENTLPKLNNKISFKNVSFSYGDKKVLDNVSLDFAIRGKYALVGSSGCGKSTVLKLLLGMLEDYQGDISFDGINSEKYNSESYYNQMAYIGQDVFLFNSTVRDNITLGHNFTEEEINKAVEDS
ncbi:MAG: ABC transporter ATP-binding protein, partial [Oscillospiraceae bacterium]